MRSRWHKRGPYRNHSHQGQDKKKQLGRYKLWNWNSAPGELCLLFSLTLHSIVSTGFHTIGISTTSPQLVLRWGEPRVLPLTPCQKGEPLVPPHRRPTCGVPCLSASCADRCTLSHSSAKNDSGFWRHLFLYNKGARGRKTLFIKQFSFQWVWQTFGSFPRKWFHGRLNYGWLHESFYKAP